LLELRLIAEIGLIGLPNAGKSSLLSVLTHATPKIANYPFTTIEPNIGMLGDHPIADIPGLIEGAAHGRGLGAKFLKHIEKTRILVHCIELTENNVEERYNTVRKEFAEFNKTLLEKPEIILLTKTDLVDEKTVKKYKSMFEKKGKQVLTCSVYDQKSIEALKKVLESQLYKNDYTTSISVERSQKEAFDKISRVSEWWAKNFEGNSQKLYDIFTVRFGSGDMYKIKISEFIRDKKIVWQVIESDQTWHEERDEWTGTEIIWEVTKQKDGTRIDMTHKGLIPTSECYDKCKVGWDYLIQKSLFQFLTENKGLPV
jgi:ribosome-binding ATPase YchF (GTP1/OBG family)